MILAFARRQSYEPGINLEGEQAENIWLFLLPHLTLRRVVFVGSPSRGTRIACGAFGARLTDATASSLAEAMGEDCDLVWIGAKDSLDVASDTAAVAVLDRLLADGGNVYVESSEDSTRLAVGLAASLQVSSSVEFAPAREPPASFSSLSSAITGRTAWLVPHSQTPRWSSVQRLVRLLRRLAARRTVTRPSERLIGVSRVSKGVPEPCAKHGVLLRGESRAVHLPDYIKTVANRHGHDLGDARWAVALQRGYRSQKVVFHVPDRDLIVKVTQDARFNHRLENEYDALRILAQSTLPDPAMAPRALFSELHGEVLVVGESRLEGVPFRDRSDGSPSCPIAHAVLDALTGLAEARTGVGNGREAAEGLAELLERHSVLHQPPANHIRFLKDQVSRVAEAGSELRAAFLHGDPTTLNILVAGDRVGLVDWENAEPAGLPLWDVIHFVGAYAGWSRQRDGRRWTPRVAHATLLEPSPFHTLLAEAVTRYRRATGLPREVVVPLIFTWWMMLALREATRLAPSKVSRGLYARLLARAVAAGETPALTRLGGAPRP